MEESLWNNERVPGEVELAICRAGEGLDPIVCLHGITAQHRAFNAAARYVGPSHGLVGVDLRGRGNSDKPESGYSLEAHAADVVRVLDHLDLEDAVLAGHSMGGFVALKTALTFPERVRALVLLDGGWPRVESTPSQELMERAESAVPAGAHVLVFQRWASWVEFSRPDLFVFVDSRIEVFDETTWDDYHTVADGGDGWEAVLDRYEVDAVMVSAEQTAVIDGLSEALGWKTVSIDDTGAMFVRG